MTLFLPRRCPEGVSRLPGVTVRGPRSTEARGGRNDKSVKSARGSLPTLVLRINGRRRAIERVGTNWQTRRRRFRWRRSSRYARKKRSRVLSDMAGARPDLTVEGSLRQNASNISTPRVRTAAGARRDWALRHPRRDRSLKATPLPARPEHKDRSVKDVNTLSLRLTPPDKKKIIRCITRGGVGEVWSHRGRGGRPKSDSSRLKSSGAARALAAPHPARPRATPSTRPPPRPRVAPPCASLPCVRRRRLLAEDAA